MGQIKNIKLHIVTDIKISVRMLKETSNRESERNETSTGSTEDGDKTGRLSVDTLKYFQRVEQVLDDNVFDDEEHKSAFMRNVFNEMQTDGTHLSRHSQKTSRIIEKIIPCLDSQLFGQFTILLEEEIDMLACDRFASHVIETLCKSSVAHVSDEVTCEIFVKFCRVLRKKCDKLLRDTYGSHVLSTALQVLSGVRVPEVLTKSKASRNAKKKKKKFKGVVNENKPDITEPIVSDVPRLYKKCFKKFVQVIQEDINFGELLCHRNASPVLQVLLLATSKVSEANFLTLYESIVSRGKLMDVPLSGGDMQDDEEFAYRLPVVFTDEIGSHLFEAVIRSANTAQLHSLGEKCFKRCILSLCVHPLANYLAQTYIKSIQDTEHVDFFITRLLKYIEDILAAGSMTIVVRLAELINKYQKVEYQKKLITTLSEVLHIPETANTKPLCKLLLCMKTYDLKYKQEKSAEEEEDTEKKESDDSESTKPCPEKDNIVEPMLTNEDLNYHGCCLLNNLLSFKKSKLVVESFLQLSNEEVKLVACHPNGSFAVETFFQCESIPNKSKASLAEMYLGCVEEISSNKWGSRVVDAMYKGIDDSLQERLKFILRKHKSRLESDLYGRIVLYNCGVKQHVDKMRKVEEQQEKKRKLFEGIIGDNKEDAKEIVAPVPVKKKKDDRATKYRKQLELLGISYSEEGKDTTLQSESTAKVKEEVDPTAANSPDDLADVLLAIEASVKQQHKPKRVKAS